MTNKLWSILILVAGGCAVDPTGETEQAISSSAAVQICRNDTQQGSYGITVHGISFTGYTEEDFGNTFNSYWGGGGFNVVATTSTDCSGNLSVTGQVQQFATTGLDLYEPSTNTYLTLPIPANGGCLYTNGYTAQTWPGYLTTCGGGGGGTTSGGTANHYYM